MTNYVKLWMEENDLEINEEFKADTVFSLVHINEEYELKDDYGFRYSMRLNDLLTGELAIIKPKNKLTKEQYDFINSFKGFDSFEIKTGTLILRDTHDSCNFDCLRLRCLKANFDNLEKGKVYYIKDIDVDYAEAA